MFDVNINEIAKLLNKNVWVVTNVNSIHKIRAKEAHCVSGGRNWRMSFQE